MSESISRRISRKQFAAFITLLALTGCSPGLDPTSGLGKQALLDQANYALTTEDCAQAITLIKPVYASENTDNKVRMMMASAYACEATINLFEVVNDLIANSSAIAGAGFWNFLALEFPSTTNDRVSEAAQLAQDALHSVISPAAVILPTNMYNTDTFNPGALTTQDRYSDANAFLFFVSMAAIGSIENRYGSPDSNGKRGTATLPWMTATSIKATGTATEADGCAYASAIVNYVDALDGLASSTSGKISDTFASLHSTFSSAIYQACDQGCTVICGLSSCPTCPATLRNRSSCAGTVTDPASCAAAGIVNFLVNTPLVGWEQGP
jgi:hypothetical protein